MITAWIIGLLLGFLGIWFLKNSRHTESWRHSKGGEPVLKMWALILLIIGTIVPVLNIILGLAVIIWWAIETYGEDNWEFTQTNNKVIKFLNKPIG